MECTTCTMIDSSDWSVKYYMAIGCDALVHAPADGWPEDIVLAVADAPACDAAALRSLAGAWDSCKIEPWVGTMVLPTGKLLRCGYSRI